MFGITDGKGFHVTFENGWTISVQFGPCNYGDHYHVRFDPRDPDKTSRECGAQGSHRAEMWAFVSEAPRRGPVYPPDPLGYQTPAEFAAFVAKVASFPKNALPADITSTEEETT